MAIPGSEVNPRKTSLFVTSNYPNPDPTASELDHEFRGSCTGCTPHFGLDASSLCIHLTLISRADWLAVLYRCRRSIAATTCSCLSVSLHTTRHEYYQLNPQLVAHLSLRRFKHCLPFHFEWPGPTLRTSTADTTASATPLESPTVTPVLITTGRLAHGSSLPPLARSELRAFPRRATFQLSSQSRQTPHIL